MKKVLPNSLSTEELLNAIDSASADQEEQELEIIPDSLSDDNSILVFCSNFSIYPGQNPIKMKLLYKLYKLNTKRPVGYYQFKHFIGDYLLIDPVMTTDRYIYVLINRDSLDLTNKIQLTIKTKNHSKVMSKKYNKRLQMFIKEKKLEHGRVPIDVKALYYLYDEWAYVRRNKFVPYRVFYYLCQVYFKNIKTTKYCDVVKVNQAFIDTIPAEKLQAAKEWGKKFRAKR